MTTRWHDSVQSFLTLPRWVRIWAACVLVPANTAPVFLLHTPSGRAAASASLFVVATNVPIMLQQRGMSRLLSLPHLIAWIPLCLFLIDRLAHGGAFTQAEWVLAVGLLAINGLSLAFDGVDTLRWFTGHRGTPRRIASGRSTSC